MTNSVFVSKVFQREDVGTAYGNDIYKVRLADESKGSGKRGGFRVMYYHLRKTEQGIDVLLMSIYNKADKATIKKQEALQILNNILKEHETPPI